MPPSAGSAEGASSGRRRSLGPRHPLCVDALQGIDLVIGRIDDGTKLHANLSKNADRERHARATIPAHDFACVGPTDTEGHDPTIQ